MIGGVSWWWLRHARVIGGANKLYGRIDLPCDTGDTISFDRLAAAVPEDAVWLVTPLSRTRQTFDALASAGAPVTYPEVEPAFIEQDFGDWQGLGWSEMQAREPKKYKEFWQDPVRNAPPGGESFAAVIERVRDGIATWCQRADGRSIVVVAHGGSIRAAVAVALGLTPEAAMAVVIDPLSLTRLDKVPDGLLQASGGVWRVTGVNVPPVLTSRATPARRVPL